MGPDNLQKSSTSQPQPLSESVMCSLLSGTCRGIYSSQLQEKAARTEVPSEQQSEHLCITSKPHSKETLSSGPVFLMAYIPVSVWDLQVLDYNRLFLKQSRSHFRHCLGAAPAPTLCTLLQAGLLHTWHQRVFKPTYLCS